MAIKKYYVVVDNFGTTRWYKDTKCNILHRENGPAIEYADGDKFWLQDGLLHRTDGPAIERANGDIEWWQKDQAHRENGPAIEQSDGATVWFISGKQMSEAEFLAATQPVVELTVADVEKLVGKRVKIIK